MFFGVAKPPYKVWLRRMLTYMTRTGNMPKSLDNQSLVRFLYDLADKHVIVEKEGDEDLRRDRIWIGSLYDKTPTFYYMIDSAFAEERDAIAILYGNLENFDLMQMDLWSQFGILCIPDGFLGGDPANIKVSRK